MTDVVAAMCQGSENSQSEQMPDDQLLAAYRNGDEHAAEVLHGRYTRRLWRLAQGQMGPLLREVEDPSDIVQSAFESFFGRAREGKIKSGPSESLWPLLAAIVVNKVRKHGKFWTRQQRDRRRHLSLEDCDPLVTGPGHEDAARAQETIRQLLEPFNPRRQEIVRYLLQDLPIVEIAHRVGTSKRTVYRTRHAAMQILEQILAAS